MILDLVSFHLSLPASMSWFHLQLGSPQGCQSIAFLGVIPKYTNIQKKKGAMSSFPETHKQTSLLLMGHDWVKYQSWTTEAREVTLPWLAKTKHLRLLRSQPQWPLTLPPRLFLLLFYSLTSRPNFPVCSLRKKPTVSCFSFLGNFT